MSTRNGAPTLTMIFAEQECLGHFVARGRDGLEAFSADDRTLGTFLDPISAAAAVVAAAKRFRERAENSVASRDEKMKELNK